MSFNPSNSCNDPGHSFIEVNLGQLVIIEIENYHVLYSAELFS